MSLSPNPINGLEKLPNLARFFIRIIRPFSRVNLPDETTFRRGLIVGSSTSDKVNHLIELSIHQYPMVQFRILVDDRNGAKVSEKWPNSDIQTFHKAIGRQEKFELITTLINEQYDICFVLGAGDLHYDFLRGLGLVSGSAYIKVFNELFSSFYFMAGQWKPILKHLAWRSKHQPVSDTIHVKIPFYRTGVGFIISFFRVIPLLQNAKRLEDARNPFLDE